MLVALSAVAMSMVAYSCAQDEFDDGESFSHSVRNTQMASPEASNVSIAPNATRTNTNVSWPVQYGAVGFHVVLTYVDAAGELKVATDTVVDGYSLLLPRTEDTEYTLSIQTLGDKSLGNSDAPSATTIAFDSYTLGYQSIPSGTDLYEYFKDFEWPASDEELMFDLEKGGVYTVSGKIDFKTNNVGLRTLGNTPHATVSYLKNGAIEYSAGMTLKELDVNLDSCSNPLLAFSKEAVVEEYKLGNASNSYRHIVKPTNIKNCNVEGLQTYIIYDNQENYWIKDFVVDGCVFHTKTTSKGQAGALFFVNKGNGAINDLKVENTTFYNTGEAAVKYIVQYGGNRCTKAGYETCSVTFNQCTFYSMCIGGQFGNYSGFSGKAESGWAMTKCIFMNCCKDIARRFLGGRPAETYKEVLFDHNTYGTSSGDFETGQSEDGSTVYDNSESAIVTDPGFRDAANGDFTVSGSEQIAAGTGDPRWLP